jgi:Domain of unknown function (DUF4411)
VIHVFDTNAFSQIFHSFYRGRFPTLWSNFDQLVEEGLVTSTREVYREIEDDRVKSLREWAKDRKELFPAPGADEAVFVAKIFSVKHFQQVIEQKKLLKGGKNADPFVIARAAVLGGTVVTMGSEPKNGAKIPNICRHFGIPCGSLEGFMEAEGWQF